MIIRSDFRDTYDAWQTADGPAFVRDSTGGPGKREQFEILKSIGCKIPPIGLVDDVCGMWWEEERQWVNGVVAYEDERKHCGEGKRLLLDRRHPLHVSQPSIGRSRPDEIESRRLGQLFCSAFVGDAVKADAYHRGESFRYLQVGPHHFWLCYKSSESWMSNVGEGETEVVELGFDRCEYAYPLPLYAIDFVFGKRFYAVDLNIAPGIGNVLDGYLTGQEIHDAIDTALRSGVSGRTK